MTEEKKKKIGEITSIIEKNIQKIYDEERKKETPQQRLIKSNKDLLLDYTLFLKTSNISLTSGAEFIYEEYLKIHKYYNSYYNYRNNFK